MAKYYHLIMGLCLLPVITTCTKAKEEKSLQTYLHPKRGLLEGKIDWRGIIRSANRIEIRNDRKIKIARAAVVNYQKVSKGQLLLEIDRSEAQGKRAELEDKLKQQELELQTAKTKYDHNEKIAMRKKGLLEKGIVAQKEFDAVNRELQLSATELKAKELDIQKARRDSAEIEEELKASNYYAPLDGVVAGMGTIDPAQEIQPGQLLAVVSDPKTPALWVQVEENNLHRVHAGTAIDLTLDSFPGRNFAGKVLEISVTANDRQKIKTYDMSIAFDPKGVEFTEGYTGMATLTYAQKKGALSLPISALRYLEDKRYVLASAIEGGQAAPKAIQTGLETDDEIEILSGINENDLVVIEAN